MEDRGLPSQTVSMCSHCPPGGPHPFNPSCPDPPCCLCFAQLSALWATLAQGSSKLWGPWERLSGQLWVLPCHTEPPAALCLGTRCRAGQVVQHKPALQKLVDYDGTHTLSCPVLGSTETATLSQRWPPGLSPHFAKLKPRHDTATPAPMLVS